jgi:hypothetical protein
MLQKICRQGSSAMRCTSSIEIACIPSGSSALPPVPADRPPYGSNWIYLLKLDATRIRLEPVTRRKATVARILRNSRPACGSTKPGAARRVDRAIVPSGWPKFKRPGAPGGPPGSGRGLGRAVWQLPAPVDWGSRVDGRPSFANSEQFRTP